MTQERIEKKPGRRNVQQTHALPAGQEAEGELRELTDRTAELSELFGDRAPCSRVIDGSQRPELEGRTDAEAIVRRFSGSQTTGQ